MRLYVPKNINREVYIRTLSTIRDYPRLKVICNMNNKPSDIMLDEYKRKVRAFEYVYDYFDEHAKNLIREHLFRGIKFDNCSYPGSTKTMSRIVRMFIILLAKALGELE